MHPRRRAFLAAIVLFTAALPLRSETVTDAMRVVETVRGVRFLRPVASVPVPRAALPERLTGQMAKGLPYAFSDWAAVLRALQLVDVPEGELLPRLLDLYQSQVLAYYDPAADTYYTVDPPPQGMDGLDQTVAIHELVHALQDQRFDLGTRAESLEWNSDAAMAYHALVEGEASLVMLAAVLAKSGMKLGEVLANEALAGALVSSAAAEAAIDPAAPRYFVEELKFVYLEGLSFVVDAYRRGGWKAVDALHANPPRSTREIYEVSDYLRRVSASGPALGATDDRNPFTDTLGEFHWRLLVGEDAARGWVADLVTVTFDEACNASVSVDSTWRTPDDAQRFATAYVRFLENRGIGTDVAISGSRVRVRYAAPSSRA